MPMYNLIEYNDNYAKTSGSLWQYCLDKPALNNGAIVDFADNNLTDSFNFKVKFTGQTEDNGTKNVNVNLILTWSSTCVIVSTNNANQVATFTITDTRLYVPVVTLSAHGNAKLLQQLKSGFKRLLIGISIYQNQEVSYFNN